MAFIYPGDHWIQDILFTAVLSASAFWRQALLHMPMPLVNDGQLPRYLFLSTNQSATTLKTLADEVNDMDQYSYITMF